ncbi:GNAT family N-acetyltransferase [Pseudomonadota bacterium]|nr:GNAT family N-acetyltransferase [Pseudomonadota bacterium]|tara:strand:+ start:158 stop:766 length:609 start_codon:yes stop_codon:yes gene_type:complete
MYILRDANTKDLEDIANVHLKEFPNSFLSQLERKFLVFFYKYFIESHLGFIKIVEENHFVVGFAAGTNKPKEFYSKFKKEYFFRVFCILFPVFLKKPNIFIGRIFEFLTYSGSQKKVFNNYSLLSSIAVLKEHRKDKNSLKLLSFFIKGCKELGSDGIYLTTDIKDNESVISFYEKNNFKIKEIFRQKSGRKLYTMALSFSK